jgi:hypothetical protein
MQEAFVVAGATVEDENKYHRVLTANLSDLYNNIAKKRVKKIKTLYNRRSVMRHRA